MYRFLLILIILSSIPAASRTRRPPYGDGLTLEDMVSSCHDPNTGRGIACPDDPRDPLIKEPSGRCIKSVTKTRSRCPDDPQWHAEQDARLAKKREQDELEAKQREAHLNEARSKRDPTDVVAQVLNYTITGNEEGTQNNFWFRPDANKACVYERVSGVDETKNKIVDVVNVFAMAFTTTLSAKSIDLNNLDPEGLRLQFADQLGRYVMTHDGKTLVLVSNDADPERVKRGWSVIYENGLCKGLKRAF